MRRVAIAMGAEAVSLHSIDTSSIGIAWGSDCSCTLKSNEASCVRSPLSNARVRESPGASSLPAAPYNDADWRGTAEYLTACPLVREPVPSQYGDPLQ